VRPDETQVTAFCTHCGEAESFTPTDHGMRTARHWLAAHNCADAESAAWACDAPHDEPAPSTFG